MAKGTTFKRSQRGHLWSKDTTVYCRQRPQHLGVHREAIRVLRPSQFIVAKDSNIWEFTERLPMVKYRHSLLWPNATTFERSQRDYLQPKSATVPCDQRPHHLKNHNGQDAQQHCCLYKDIHWITTDRGDVDHFHSTLK